MFYSKGIKMSDRIDALDLTSIKDSIAQSIRDAEIAIARKTAWTSANLISHDDIHSLDAGPARFNFLSLPAWLAVAERASVPFIPATELASLAKADFIDMINGVENDNALSFLSRGADIDADELIRFEQCGPGSLKSSLSNGEGVSRGVLADCETGEMTIDAFDPRIYETFISLGADRLRAYRRPLVATQHHHDTWTLDNRTPEQPNTIEGDWPVEFRVFAREGRITGVSNYYPQMTLPDTYLDAAREAARLGRIMADWMDSVHLGVGNGDLCGDIGSEAADTRADWIPETWGPQDFTLDFLMRDDGELLFLEGGPGGFRAAAPCCFETGPRDPATLLTGIKLGRDTDVHPL